MLSLIVKHGREFVIPFITYTCLNRGIKLPLNTKNVIIAQNMPLSQAALTKDLVGDRHEKFIHLPG